MEALGSRPTVTAPEVAQLVAHYLESSFPATGRLFAKEASTLLARAPPLPPSSSLKPLAAVVEEYAALSAAHAQVCTNSARFVIPARAILTTYLAAQRRRFERAFGGDDALVRRCLANVATLLDDYVAATRPQRAPGRSRRASGRSGGSRPTSP